MKATIINHIKVSWHCLINFHCKYIVNEAGNINICCYNCDYAEDEKTKISKKEFKDLNKIC